MSDANLTATTITNFRDMGGLPAADGRRVAPGRLLRSGALHDAGDDDLARLQDAGLSLVFDLRSHTEAKGSPDRVPAGARYRCEPAVASMDDVQHDWLDWGAMVAQLEASEQALKDAEDFQYGVYPQMAREPGAFALLLAELVDDPGAVVLLHCSAGKDRTGVASAIILRLLGTPHEAIMADYLESAKHPLPETESVLALVRGHDPRVEKLVRCMLTVTPDQLDAAFDQMDEAWGGWDGFVAKALNLQPKAVSKLQESYLSN